MTREDRRVRRTRAALTQALLVLMTTKSYEAITVQDLIDRADVGRSTFYAHFADKDELLDESVEVLRAMVEEPGVPHRPTRGQPLPFATIFFHHVSDQRGLLSALLGHGASGTVTVRLERVLQETAEAQLRALIKPGQAQAVPLELLARAAVASCLACLRWWIDTGFNNTPDELDTMFRELTTPVVGRVLDPHHDW
ncbi:TetR/AcrR family transcriptional regulator [Arthrobacter sp. NyZ413]|uniref:TetR/AcrR family transcriptional regulator n=1 Tax=Arthrobacter sp. NyZ413 TaxID=3144669 RepID=UPI002D0170C1|nr:TetR/AcrR family transcriptional regulator [Arthrobacter sp.]